MIAVQPSRRLPLLLLLVFAGSSGLASLWSGSPTDRAGSRSPGPVRSADDRMRRPVAVRTARPRPAVAAIGRGAVTDRPATAAGSLPGPRDEEWDGLPRTDLAVARLFLRWRPDASYLFRHRRLNAGDGYIPRPERRVLTELVRRHGDLLDAAERRVQRALHAGITALVAGGEIQGTVAPASSGRRVRIDLDRTGVVGSGASGAPAARAVQRMLRERTSRIRVSTSLQRAYHYQDGRCYDVPLARLPAARQAIDAQRRLCRRFAAEVLAYFQSRGLLAPALARRLTGQLERVR